MNYYSDILGIYFEDIICVFIISCGIALIVRAFFNTEYIIINWARNIFIVIISFILILPPFFTSSVKHTYIRTGTVVIYKPEGNEKYPVDESKSFRYYGFKPISLVTEDGTTVDVATERCDVVWTGQYRIDPDLAEQIVDDYIPFPNF